jgi:hypothetical protein
VALIKVSAIAPVNVLNGFEGGAQAQRSRKTRF